MTEPNVQTQPSTYDEETGFNPTEGSFRTNIQSVTGQMREPLAPKSGLICSL